MCYKCETAEAVEVADERGEHTLTGLPHLARPDLHRFIPGMMKDVSYYEMPKYKPQPFPARPSILGIFKPMRVRKKGYSGKKASLEGYVWGDVDPQAILLNRYVVRSCHTLDNRYEFRAGNYTHAYCPFMFSIFAGKNAPTRQRDAISPVTERPLYVDGDLLRMRDHQAAANAYLMLDSEGRPYIYLVRIYDSCGGEGGKPWVSTIIRYLKTLCKRHGLGFVISTYHALWHEGEKDADKVYAPRAYDTSADLASPAFTLPWGTDITRLYGDGELRYRLAGVNDDQISATGSGYLIVRPRLKNVDGLAHPGYIGDKCEFIGEPLDPPQCNCCSNELRLTDNGGPGHEVNGQHYCSNCRERHFHTCGECQEITVTSQMVTAGDQFVCTACAGGRACRCRHCYAWTLREACDEAGVCHSCRQSCDLMIAQVEAQVYGVPAYRRDDYYALLSDSEMDEAAAMRAAGILHHCAYVGGCECVSCRAYLEASNAVELARTARIDRERREEHERRWRERQANAATAAAAATRLIEWSLVGDGAEVVAGCTCFACRRRRERERNDDFREPAGSFIAEELAVW